MSAQHGSTQPVIAIVVPCYNEEANIAITAPRLLEVLSELVASRTIAPESYIYCVDDGSTDGTWSAIRALNGSDSRIKGHTLTHNRGHQNALLSGLMAVKDSCDAAVSIDADLQDDVNAISEMVDAYLGGAEIVYGVRASRRSDTWFKRNTARGFYRMQNALGLETVNDHADFRLMSRRALDILSEYRESNLFLRGIVPQIGLDTAIVYYDRRERRVGKSKYSLKRMLEFSLDGVTSFSSRPMTLIFFTGLLLLLLDVITAIYVLISYFTGHSYPGWSSLMLSVWFLGSLILMAIGVVGIYIGKIFIEVKQRPRYNIKERIG